MFTNLPPEIQLEVFSFLSVKYLGIIQVLNTKISYLILDSNQFWIELVNNYARIVLSDDKKNIDRNGSDRIDHSEIINILKELIQIKHGIIHNLRCELSRITTVGISFACAKRQKLEYIEYLQNDPNCWKKEGIESEEKKQALIIELREKCKLYEKNESSINEKIASTRKELENLEV